MYELKGNIKDITRNMDNSYNITFTVHGDYIFHLLDEFKDKLLSIVVKLFRNKRSLDANAALWLLLGEMAARLNTSKDELYLEVLDRYGVFTFIAVKPAVVERVKREWRTVRELGEVTVNGQTGIQLQCFFGSSTYDSREFSVLLNGVIEEAKEMGIYLISDSDRDLMLREWRK